MRVKCEVNVVMFDQIKVERLKYSGFINEEIDAIDVSYDIDSSTNYYVGKKHGDGHWILHPKNNEWEETLTLHRIPNSKYYEGYFKGKYDDNTAFDGFWRIII